jgi:alpha-glucuronidase
MYNNLATCPTNFLFWFHHVAYTNDVYPGETVSQWIYDTHFAGAAAMTNMITQWQTLSNKMSSARYNDVLGNLNAQAVQAGIWQHAANSFFWNWSQIPDAYGRDVSTP